MGNGFHWSHGSSLRTDPIGGIPTADFLCRPATTTFFGYPTEDASDRIGTRGTIQIPDEIVEKMFVRGNQVYAEA